MITRRHGGALPPAWEPLSCGGRPGHRHGTRAAKRLDGATARRFGRVVVRLLFLVFLDEAVELVRQRVDGGVHVLGHGIGVQGATADMRSGFSLVLEFLDSKDAVEVDDLIEVT